MDLRQRQLINISVRWQLVMDGRSNYLATLLINWTTFFKNGGEGE